MKFLYYQSDVSSNTFTKFINNPTHSKRNVCRKSGTDTHTQIHTHRDKFCRSHSPQTVTIKSILFYLTFRMKPVGWCFVTRTTLDSLDVLYYDLLRTLLHFATYPQYFKRYSGTFTPPQKGSGVILSLWLVYGSMYVSM